MFFGTPQMLKQISVDSSFAFLGKTIQPVQTPKDLGLIMDSILSFDEHIKQSVSFCIKKLYQINRINSRNDYSMTSLFQAVLLFYCLALNKLEEHLTM